MLRLAVRYAASCRNSYLLAVIGIATGVVLFSAISILVDSFGRATDLNLARAYAHSDLVVTTQSSAGMALDRRHIQALRETEGVAQATGFVQVQARLTDDSGAAMEVSEYDVAPLAGSWISEPTANPFSLARGRPPVATREVVVDSRAAEAFGFRIGDQAWLSSPAGVERFTIVGISRFGSEDSPGNMVALLFAETEAQRLMDMPGQVSEIHVAIDADYSRAEVEANIEAAIAIDSINILPTEHIIDDLEYRLTADLRRTGRSYIRFSYIAMAAGVLLSKNSFSFVVQRRLRELALIRLLGATRRQTVLGFFAESLIVGLVGSGIGFVAAIGISKLAITSLDRSNAAAGSELVIEPRTLATSMLLGVGITLLAGLVPTLRAARVRPLAAMRDVDHQGTSFIALRVLLGCGLIGAAGVAAAHSDGALVNIAGSFGLAFCGVLTIGPAVMRPTLMLIGVPLRLSRRVSSRLAVLNAIRNPGRTTATAATLAVAVSVTIFATVSNVSQRASLSQDIASTYEPTKVDYIVEGDYLSDEVLGHLRQTPSVRLVAGLRRAAIAMDGVPSVLVGSDTREASELLGIEIVSGDEPPWPANSIAISESLSLRHDWHLGERVGIEFATGDTRDVTITAILRDSSALQGDALTTRSLFEEAAPGYEDTEILVDIEPEVDSTIAEEHLANTLDQFEASQLTSLRDIGEDRLAALQADLSRTRVLLTITFLVGLVAVVNAVLLSAVERRPELNLLRAVGANQGQVRRILRLEAILASLVGAVIAIVTGVSLAVISVEDARVPVAAVCGISALAVSISYIAARAAAWWLFRMSLARSPAEQPV